MIDSYILRWATQSLKGFLFISANSWDFGTYSLLILYLETLAEGEGQNLDLLASPRSCIDMLFNMLKEHEWKLWGFFLFQDFEADFP